MSHARLIPSQDDNQARWAINFIYTKTKSRLNIMGWHMNHDGLLYENAKMFIISLYPTVAVRSKYFYIIRIIFIFKIRGRFIHIY